MKKRTQKICAQLMEWSAPTERQEIEESLCELASLHCPREVWAVVQAVLVRVNREVEHLARTECPCVSSPSPSKRPKTEQGRENTPGEARRPSVCAEQTEKIEGWVHKVGSVCIRKCEYLEEEEHRAGIRLLDSVLEGCLSLARHKSCVCLYGLSEKLAGIAAVLSRPKEEHEQQHVGGDVDRDVDRDDGDVGGGDGDVGGGARTSLDLLCKLSQMWTPEDTKTVQGIKYVQEICTHAPKTERRKASSFFCRLLRTGCLSGMHALCMHALEKDIHSLEDLLHLFGTEHIEADMLRLPIEDRSSVDLLLVGAVYLYYKRTSLHPLIAHLEEACTEWLEDKPLTFEVCISGCMHSLVVFVLGMLVHVSGSTERVSSPRLLWSLKAAVSFLYGTHTQTRTSCRHVPSRRKTPFSTCCP
ncbi:hypothetical protein NECID01_1932 [Nematocida sp. AWRm77]|nr:hypothetical protein NECID01_1932 [Nematocida sp. AWRm77]